MSSEQPASTYSSEIIGLEKRNNFGSPDQKKQMT